MPTKGAATQWTLETQERWPFTSTIKCGEIVIAELPLWGFSTGDKNLEDAIGRHPVENGECLANYKLMAAAPELLEAAKLVLHDIDEGSIKWTHKKVCEVLSAAIAKAGK